MKRRLAKGFTLFDVTYVDGSRTSHRKVPTAALADPNDEAAVKAIIEAQDREIAHASGRPRAAIKSVTRSRA
jgi:hypothetical protein